MSWNPLSRRAKAPNASPKMPPKTTTPPQTVADLFLQTLAEAKVDYIFAVLGSDHPSIIEAYMKRQHEGKIWPKMLIFQHEVRNVPPSLPKHISRKPSPLIFQF